MHARAHVDGFINSSLSIDLSMSAGRRYNRSRIAHCRARGASRARDEFAFSFGPVSLTPRR